MATTTPNYGWPVPTSTDYVKDGATAIEALGDAIDATVFGLGGGLTFVKAQTVGSAVSTVTVTNAFSSKYANYKVIYSGGNASNSNQGIIFKLNNSSGSTYSLAAFYILSSGTSAINSQYNTSGGITAGLTGTNSQGLVCDILNPFAIAQTTFAFNGYEMSGASNVSYTTVGAGSDSNAASSTDLVVTLSGGTITGGVIRVYGYQD